jgi:hypothetical protein
VLVRHSNDGEPYAAPRNPTLTVVNNMSARRESRSSDMRCYDGTPCRTSTSAAALTRTAKRELRPTSERTSMP